MIIIGIIILFAIFFSISIYDNRINEACLFFLVLSILITVISIIYWPVGEIEDISLDLNDNVNINYNKMILGDVEVYAVEVKVNQNIITPVSHYKSVEYFNTLDEAIEHGQSQIIDIMNKKSKKGE